MGPTTPVTEHTGVPDALVTAALEAAQALERDVHDVSVAEIARHAGMSRATLLRRLGGTRGPLDEAVRESGVDPGGRSVHERGLEAAAMVISDRGLAGTTMEAIAQRADCSVDSLYTVFGCRDQLLADAFAAYTPLGLMPDDVLAHSDDLLASVERLYRRIALVLAREPRVAPAMLSEILARADGPVLEAIAETIVPRMYASVGQWLQGLVADGRIRDLPLLMLVHQLVAPIIVHLMAGPSVPARSPFTSTDAEVACVEYAETFIRAVATDPDAELDRHLANSKAPRWRQHSAQPQAGSR